MCWCVACMFNCIAHMFRKGVQRGVQDTRGLCATTSTRNLCSLRACTLCVLEKASTVCILHHACLAF